MNRILIIGLLLFGTLTVTGQSDESKYRYYLQKGQEQFDAENYREANRLFKAAEISTKNPNLQRKALNLVILADERYVEALQRARDTALAAQQRAFDLLARAVDAESQALREARFSDAVYRAFIAEQEIEQNTNDGLDHQDTVAMQLAYEAKQLIAGDTGYVGSIDGVFGRAAYMATRNVLRRHRNAISDLWIHPNGSFTSSGRDSLIISYDGTEADHLMAGEFIQSIQIFADDLVVAVLRDSKKVAIWKGTGRESQYKKLSFAPHRIHKILYQPDVNMLCVALEEDGLHFIDLNQDVDKGSVEAGKSIRDIRFSHDSMKIVSRSADGMVGIWQINGDKITAFRAHDKYVYGASFSNNDEHILTYSADHTARLWNLDGSLFSSLESHRYPVCHGEFSPDGRYILTYSIAGEANVWSPEGQLINTFPAKVGYIERATFHPNSNSVLAVSGNHLHEITIFGDFVRTFNNALPVRGFDVSADGKSLLTWGYDSSVKVWDLNPSMYHDTEVQGHLLMDIELQDAAEVTIARFSSAGDKVYVGMEDGTIQLVPMPHVTMAGIAKTPFMIPHEYLDRHNMNHNK